MRARLVLFNCVMLRGQFTYAILDTGTRALRRIALLTNARRSFIGNDDDDVCLFGGCNNSLKSIKLCRVHCSEYVKGDTFSFAMHDVGGWPNPPRATRRDNTVQRFAQIYPTHATQRMSVHTTTQKTRAHTKPTHTHTHWRRRLSESRRSRRLPI